MDWRKASDERLCELLEAGECFRVECELMAVLKGWRGMRQLHQLDGAPSTGDGPPQLELAALEASLARATEEGVGDEGDGADEGELKVEEGAEAEPADGEAREGAEVPTAEQAALTPQLVEWFNEQSARLRAERKRLVEAVSEARAWEEEAQALAAGRAPCDPAKLHAFVERGAASAMRLPSLPALRERARRLTGWATAVE
eukprot:390441-Prymnesium_polylepis.1